MTEHFSGHYFIPPGVYNTKTPNPADYPNIYLVDLSAGENVTHHYYDHETPDE